MIVLRRVGEATNFSKIQDGIDKASIGDTVFVYDGVYHEDIIINGLLKSSISLIGQSKEWTIVEGSVNISNTRKIGVSDLTIRGGVLEAFGETPCEVLLSFCSKCTIADCNIINYYDMDALEIYFSSKNTISNNNISAFYLNRYSGIFQFLSHHLVISGNTIIIHGIGISCNLGHSNVYKNNIFLNCGDCNLHQFSFKNLIYKNSVIHCEVCVDLWAGCFGNIITANTFGEASFLGWEGQADNHLYLNNFDLGWANDDGINFWYKSEGLFKGKGNYWGAYEDWYMGEYGKEPKDDNNDGIWDEPLKIPTLLWEFILKIKSLNKDRFPFVEPIDVNNITVSEAEAFISQIINEYNSDISEVEINSQQSNPQNNPAPQNQQSNPQTNPSSNQQQISQRINQLIQPITVKTTTTN